MPEIPNERLTILCLNNDDIECLGDDARGHEILSKTYEGLYLLNLNKYQNLSQLGLFTLDDTYLSRGNVLVLSPYNSLSYAEIGNARDCFSIQKADCFIEFCQKIGASHVEMCDIKVRRIEMEDKINLGGSNAVVEGQAEFERKKEESLSLKIKRTLTLGKSKPDIQAAKKLLNYNNLMGDSVFRQLYNLREHELLENGTPITQYEQTITLVKEHEQSLDFALKLGIKNYSALSGGYSRARNETYECESTIKVCFF